MLGRVRRSLLRGSLPNLLPSALPFRYHPLQCAAFIEKSELTTGGSLSRLPLPLFPCRLIPFASRKILLSYWQSTAHIPT